VNAAKAVIARSQKGNGSKSNGLIASILRRPGFPLPAGSPFFVRASEHPLSYTDLVAGDDAASRL
jgi:hypothetical protein